MNQKLTPEQARLIIDFAPTYRSYRGNRRKIAVLAEFLRSIEAPIHPKHAERIIREKFKCSKRSKPGGCNFQGKA